MLATAVGFLALLQAASGAQIVDGVAGAPAYAPDGRLAVSVRGNIWIAAPDRETGPEGLVRITESDGHDTEPAWTPTGKALVFASDRAGTFDLWRVPLGPDGPAGEPERLTESARDDREVAVGADGSMVFVRGRGPAAELWRRLPDGTERLLIDADGAERWPALSPDGGRVAYVAVRTGRHEVRVRDLETGADTAIGFDRSGAAHPAWSPDGERLALTASGRDRGVWLTSPDGGYANLVSRRRAAASWAPGGERLALADLPPEAPSYNGDPRRIRNRRASDAFPAGGRLWTIRVPAAPDASIAERPLRIPLDRERRNATVFDRVASRVESLYYADADDGERRAEWRRLRERYRDRALAAEDDDALETVIHELIRARPPAMDPAVGRAAVSSAHPLATAAGTEVLRKGGNVVDAAVAVSFALGVVEPDASGIGGYGQMVLHLEGMEEPVAIEFLTRVPEAASLDNGALQTGDGRLPADGPVLPNVPGTVAGMWKAWNEHGSGDIEWAELVEPAIRIAERGFVVDDALATTLARERERFLQYRAGRELFFPGGEPLEAGDTLRNPDLAWTLRQIADEGADAFYRGEVARRIVTDLRGRGNAMTMEDLDRYFAADRTPVRGTYRGHTIYSSAPPTTGGATLVGTLNLLKHHDDPGAYPDDAATMHAMIEARKLAPSTRGRVADPGLWPVSLEAFVSPDTARARWSCFDPERASPLAQRGREALDWCDVDDLVSRLAPREGAAGPESCMAHAHPSDCRATGTTAFAVGDADGNIVSVTQTLGTWGGSFYVTPGLGFIYNDKLRSYRTDPSAYNARVPFARNVTSISPTLVFRGTGGDARPLLAVGAAGNAWIGSAVYATVASMIDRGIGPQRALELPRFLVTGRTGPDGRRRTVVQVEDGLAPEVTRRLEAAGHELQPISLRGELRMGYGAAVMIEGDHVVAGADPRRSGRAESVPE